MANLMALAISTNEGKSPTRALGGIASNHKNVKQAERLSDYRLRRNSKELAAMTRILAVDIDGVLPDLRPSAPAIVLPRAEGRGLARGERARSRQAANASVVFGRLIIDCI